MRHSGMIGTGAYVSGRPYLSVWTMVAGHPDCVAPPLVLGEDEPAELAAVIAVNRAIATLCGRAEALEMATVMAAAAEPPVTVPAFGTAGELVEVPNPAHALWQAAVALVAAEAGNADLHHLLRTRAGSLEQDELGDTEEAWVLPWPAVPALEPYGETADWNGSSWDVRALSEDETATWPLQMPPVPEFVTRTQLRLVLAERAPPEGVAGATMLDAVDTAVAASGDRVLQERWAAERMERSSPLLIGMATTLLQLSLDEVDAIFRQAAVT